MNMEEDWQSRTRMLLGSSHITRLGRMHVAIFGVGGVGGYVAESLARCGIGHFTLIDKDEVSVSNINRQIVANVSNVGMRKTDAMRERILSINPQAIVDTRYEFFLPANAANYEEPGEPYDFGEFSYVVDCVDTVTAKIEIITRSVAAGVPVISAMGAGGKMDPTGFEIADIYDTSICPLARVMRRELKKRGVRSCKVVYSKEEPAGSTGEENPKRVPPSCIFAPAAAGLAIGYAVINDMIRDLILASGSPRRRMLLSELGYEYEVIKAEGDEITTKLKPYDIVMELAYNKAEEVRRRISDRDNYVILAADTIVAYGDEILGKPADTADAERMIHLLQGGIHQVYTGVAIFEVNGSRVHRHNYYEKTDVHVRAMTDKEIAEYVALGECYDKAGAYGIQGAFGQYIDKIEGEYNNVVGLPTASVDTILSRLIVKSGE